MDEGRSTMGNAFANHTIQAGPVGWPGIRTMLRLEGLAALAAGLAGFFSLSDDWLLLVAMFLLPDLAMAGYALGPRTGARIYNVAHTHAAPALLAAAALLWIPAALPLACIWVAHIGFDRALGYGLKYETSFHDTHLGPIGRRRASGRHPSEAGAAGSD
jgi:hypothetical protein